MMCWARKASPLHPSFATIPFRPAAGSVPVQVVFRPLCLQRRSDLSLASVPSSGFMARLVARVTAGHRQVARHLKSRVRGRMTKPKQSGAFSGHRFPPEIIGYAVWAYHRFPMSLRDVEDLLAARGIVVSYETIRAWLA